MQAKGQHDIEKSIREIGLQLGGGGPSFVTVTDPNSNWSHTAGGQGDVFIKSAAYQKVADPAARYAAPTRRT